MLLKMDSPRVDTRKVRRLCFATLLLMVFVAGCGREPLPPPTLSSISPNSGSPGQTIEVTLTGTGLVWDSTVNVNGAPITVSEAGVESTSHLHAQFAIAANATAGPVTISVTSWGITTNPVTFTIVPPPERSGQ